jgi:caspase domain-containing protein
MKQLVFIAAVNMFFCSIKAQSKYAILIGINDYYEVKGVKSEVSLHGSVNDANSIRDLLISKFGFNSKNIDTIYNADATRDHIIAGLNKKLAQCKPGDALVFYYSGHGVYMFNSDEDKDSVKQGMNQAMLTSDLYNYDDHLKCFFRDFTLKQYFNLFINKKVILTAIFDCCFSGNIAMANKGASASEKIRSVDLKALFGRLTQNANNAQLLMDSINGIPTNMIISACPTDSAGKSTRNRDSDGDGVPDCRDKEKFTDKQCFPVDEDGVGNCPFDYLLKQFHRTLNKYDSAELAKANPVVSERAFNAKAVLTITEKDTIARPVDRKNSRFLFIAASTDRQVAFEFPDDNGVRHGFFTASVLRVLNKNPAITNVADLFQKIVDDMSTYHRDQNPTLYSDPERKKYNLVGVKL